MHSGIIKNLMVCGKALASLIPTIHKSISSVINLEMNPCVKLPTTDKASEVYGDSAATLR